MRHDPGRNNTVTASSSGGMRPGGGTGLSLDVDACDFLELCDEEFVLAFEAAAAANNTTLEVGKESASAKKGAALATSQTSTSSRSISSASFTEHEGNGSKNETETMTAYSPDELDDISKSKDRKGRLPERTRSSSGARKKSQSAVPVGVDGRDEPSSLKSNGDRAGSTTKSSTSSTTTSSRTGSSSGRSRTSSKSAKAGKSSKSGKTGKSGRGLMHEEIGKAAKKSKAGNFDCESFCGCTIEPDEDPVDDQLLGILA